MVPAQLARVHGKCHLMKHYCWTDMADRAKPQAEWQIHGLEAVGVRHVLDEHPARFRPNGPSHLRQGARSKMTGKPMNANPGCIVDRQIALGNPNMHRVIRRSQAIGYLIRVVTDTTLLRRIFSCDYMPDAQ